MRSSQIRVVCQSVVLTLGLFFNASVFAQLEALSSIDANSTPDAIAAAVEQAIADGAAPDAVAQALATAGQNPQQIATVLVAANVPPAAVATSLNNLGQTPAQVTAALVAASVPPAEATVAVRTAVPTATNAQLTQGLTLAGVTGDTATAAVQAAPAAAPPAGNNAASNNVAAITGSGLLVGADGKAVVVNDEKDQLNAVVAFIDQASRNNPNALNDPEIQKGISAIVGNALAASTGGTVNSTDAAQEVIRQLQAGGQGGGNSSNSLADALNKAITVLETQTGTTLPRPGSPS